MKKKVSDEEKKEITKFFLEGKSLQEIVDKFKFTKLTIVRNLKKILGEEKYLEVVEISKSSKLISKNKNSSLTQFDDSSNEKSFRAPKQDSFTENMFFEIAPLDLEIDNLPQRDFSSISIDEVELPKTVYMIVDKQIELETKSLKDYVEWSFLSEKDLNRNTIEIFYDLKVAKKTAKKEQKVIKVPNSNVLKIAARFLKARGITRIVSSEVLIAL